MVDLDPFTAIFREIETSRFSVAIQFVDTNFPEMKLSPIVPVLNSAFTWCPLTMIYASSVICSIPLSVTQLEAMLVIELLSFCLVLNALLGTLLSKHLTLG
jgi:hypothetical protein